MLADPVLRYADIQACCACLGFREDNVYKIDADAEASIRALLRYLRNEGPDCDVRRELGRLKIVSSDLIPLLCSCTDENKILTELAIRLLMNLTQPALVCFRQEIPKDRDLYGAYAQVDDLLKSYKKDFANEELFQMLHNLVGELLDRKWEERSEEDRLLIERILILVRNVLHIAPDPLEEKRTDEDVSVHDQLIWAMHLSGWDELLLFLGNSEDEQTFAFHTLEIISLMLRQQIPDILASAGDNSKEPSKMNDVSERQWAIESSEKRRFLRDLNSRSNRFGGTYELLSTPSLSERPLIYHHDITPSLDVNCSGQKVAGSHSHKETMEGEVGLVDLDVGKRTFRKPKNRKPLIERSVHRRSILAVQLYLQKFCWQFLQYCYNPLMRTAKASLTRQATQENDETYYLWAMRFFMAFCRVYKFRSEYLSETLNAATFHWIYDQVMHYREVVFSDKRGGGMNRRALQASRRLELAVAAYREFLTCVERMFRITTSDRAPDVSAGETQEAVEDRLRIQSTAAESIMANVFYVSEYQEVYPMLIKDFNEAIQSREHLRNLIEGSHLFISLLSERLKSGSQTLFVRRRRVVRRRRARKAKPVKRRTGEEGEENDTPEIRKLRLEYQWSNQLVQPLIDGLERPTDTNDEGNEDPEESRLFDATSGGSEARQLRSAIRRVQSALFAGEALTALRLALRLWRLWPEVAPISVDENDPVLSDDRTAGLNPSQLAILGALRQIHSTEFEEEDEDVEADEEDADADDDDESEDNLYNEEMGIENDGDNEGVLVTTEKEVQMDFDAFLLKFAHPRIVYALTILLADCASNPRTTNTAVVHIMHRLAVRQKLTGSFFQLRLFYIFQQFLRNRSLSGSPEFKDLCNLIKYILRKFFEAQQQNNGVLIELLFFKTVKEGFEMVKGYGTFEDSKKSVKWNAELDGELIKLFEAYRNDPVPRGQDLADVLLRHLSDVTKTRRQIVARLVFLGLISSVKQLKQITIHPERERRPPRPTNEADRLEWTEDEIMRLRTLVENHTGSRTLLSDIMTDLAMDYELALRQQQEMEGIGDDADPPVIPPLRSRRVIGAKLLELGFVADPDGLGRKRRRRTVGAIPHRRGTLNVDLDISTADKLPGKRRKSRKRKDGSSDEELHFPVEEQDAGFGSESESEPENAIPTPRFEEEDTSESQSTGYGLSEDSTSRGRVSSRKRLRLSHHDSDSEAEPHLHIDEGADAEVYQRPELGSNSKHQNAIRSGKYRLLNLVSSSSDEAEGDNADPKHSLVKPPDMLPVPEPDCFPGETAEPRTELSESPSTRPRAVISSDSDN
ncbi:Protein timeless [Clonorchis sinensis]|uniref:Protein timeless n=1 Tax=Clonorchis sinensis TaxID=79923 RepID=A0A8T1M592_CLOSI|nr:Protein timeless [Clonorchis sinensis]